MKISALVFILALFCTSAMAQTTINDGAVPPSPSNEPIFLTGPLCNTCKRYTVDGSEFYEILHNNKAIKISQIFWEDYRAFMVWILNTGEKEFTFDPAAVVMNYSKSKDATPATSTFKSESSTNPYKIIDKLERSVFWKNLVTTMAASARTQTITTSTGGTATATNIMTGQTASGTYSGQSTTRVPDNNARREARAANAERTRNAANTGEIVDAIALRKNTVFPGQMVKGFVFVKIKDYRHAIVRFPIDGFDYAFYWVSK